MACGDITGVASAFDQYLSFTRFQRLDEYLRLVPTIAGPTFRKRKQHGLATRQHLRTHGQLVAFNAHEHFRFAAGGRYAHDASATRASLTEDDPVRTPAHTIKKGRRTQRDGRASAQSNLLERVICTRVKGDESPIRGEDGIRDTPCDLGSRDSPRFEIGDRPQVYPAVRHVRDLCAVRRKGDTLSAEIGDHLAL